MVSPRLKDPDRLECDACDQGVSWEIFRLYPDNHRTSLRVCNDHDRLASAYKVQGQEPNAEAKREWQDTAPKLAEDDAVVHELLNAERDDTYDRRSLSWRERHVNQGRDRQSLGRDLGR